MYSRNQRIAINIRHILKSLLLLETTNEEIKKLAQWVSSLECRTLNKFSTLNIIRQTEEAPEIRNAIDNLIEALVFEHMCEELGKTIKVFFAEHSTQLRQNWHKHESFRLIGHRILRQSNQVVVKQVIYEREVQQLIKEHIPGLYRNMCQLSFDIDNVKKTNLSNAALEVLQAVVGMNSEPDEIVKLIEKISEYIYLEEEINILFRSYWMQAAAQRVIESALVILKKSKDIETGWKSLEQLSPQLERLTQYEKDVFWKIFIQDFRIEGMAAGYDHWIKTGSHEKFPSNMSGLVRDAIGIFDKRNNAYADKKYRDVVVRRKILNMIKFDPEISGQEMVSRLELWKQSPEIRNKPMCIQYLDQQIQLILNAAISFTSSLVFGRENMSSAVLLGYYLIAKRTPKIFATEPVYKLIAECYVRGKGYSIDYHQRETHRMQQAFECHKIFKSIAEEAAHEASKKFATERSQQFSSPTAYTTDEKASPFTFSR